MLKKINSLFIPIRVNFRKHGSEIAEDIFYRFHPATLNASSEICVFCKTQENLTKEHVLPKWLFQNKTNIGFEIKINQQSISYVKSVVPACENCNNSILAEIEKKIIFILGNLQKGEHYDNNDLANIIRWLEILDYKLQVLNNRLKYIKYGNNSFCTDFGILPVSWMNHFWEMNPFKALSNIKFIQRSISVKSKLSRLNSLVIFNTNEPHFEFFHQPSKYIFISFPMYDKAIFYFFRKEFKNIEDSHREAIEIMEKILK
ncbi:hypothetical protein CMT56_14825 [Elizabethkingia anophelis]|uniref:hypothetical protein n=1 Tax=Elizabethkingia anophelis TaxID=1117645 RepID=UPI00099586FA|nr:hypothetical protein [Elizabethkingia anophelis]AQW93438.1 hypothetical protein BBD30_04140 [Elizabethkingia anophelis]MCT4295957.1 hypothetical protein [Elizabethkingia anophelis]MCT4299551.1 hypothetical protein [Elizabethkingia anophelis]MDV3854180.1 hypothetical protein [Elizabethkingia anophelis]MDV3861135.1 hypothetical protein [Elizabethkingia anophelis]